jgi:hypothetical protein
MESDTYTNLRQHRSEVDAWRPRGWWDRVADDPVAMSLIPAATLTLLLYGTTRRWANPSAWLLVSGAIFGCAVASVSTLRWRRAARTGAHESPTDVVTQESVDSFPASDAPSSNATTATARPPRSGM